VYNGRIHLIWTGGEPSIPKHQRAIAAFNEYIKEYRLSLSHQMCYYIYQFSRQHTL
jgi:hypothetical protein